MLDLQGINGVTETSPYHVVFHMDGMECVGYFLAFLAHFLPCLSWEADCYRQYQSDPLAFWIPLRFGQWKDSEGEIS